MIKKFLSLTIIIAAALLFTACSPTSNTAIDNEAITDTTTSVLETISAEEAKKMIDEKDDLIILDVRTSEEYNQGHIADSLLIPDYQIEDKAEELLEDKSATILVYCRSGNRSSKAAKALSKMGYTNIYDFGGIISWPYEIVTE